MARASGTGTQASGAGASGVLASRLQASHAHRHGDVDVMPSPPGEGAESSDFVHPASPAWSRGGWASAVPSSSTEVVGTGCAALQAAEGSSAGAERSLRRAAAEVGRQLPCAGPGVRGNA